MTSNKLDLSLRSAIFKKISLIILALLIGSAYYAQIAKEENNPLYTDFGKFYISTQLLWKKQNPYSQLITKTNNPDAKHFQKEAGNLNPPFFQLLMLPLRSLTFSHALWLWSLLSLLAATISIYQLQRILKMPYYPASWLIALLIYFPTFTNIVFGQVSLILLPLLINAWRAARGNKEIMLGISLGIATSLKIFFGLFIIYLLLRRQWQALKWFISSFLLTSTIPLIFFGHGIYSAYYHTMSYIWWYTSSWNASIYGYWARLFGIAEENTPLIFIPHLANLLTYVCSGFLIIFLIKFLKPDDKIPTQQKTDLDFSIVLVSMLLLSPLGWSYYFPFLIIPFIVLLQISKHNFSFNKLFPLVCLAVILTANPHTFEGPRDIKSIIDIVGWSGYYFYGLLLLLFLLFYARRCLIFHKKNNEYPKNIQLISIFCVVMLLPSFLGILKSSNTVNQLALPDIMIVKIKDN